MPEECQDTEDGGNKDKDPYDLDLLPPALFKVVVEGCHLEDALAVGQLEIDPLEEAGQHLDDEHEARQHEEKQLACHDTAAHDDRSQEQGSGVTHEHFGGVVVVDQKAQDTTQESGTHATHRLAFYRLV